MHIGLVVLVVAFLLLGQWQFSRAAEGNLLSYGYAVQWPAFAAFAIWVWIIEMRKAVRSATSDDLGHRTVVEDQSTVLSPRSTDAAGTDAAGTESGGTAGAGGAGGAGRRRARSAAAYDDSDDPELAAYNDYLAWRNAHPTATLADYPGPPASKELTS